MVIKLGGIASGKISGAPRCNAQRDWPQECVFPALYSQKFLQREAEHVDGFAKECAAVTHSRLEADADGIYNRQVN